MCMIIINQFGQRIGKEMSAAIALANNDGFGRVCMETGRRKRTMSTRRAVNWIRSQRPAAIHCRMATDGDICIENCHPFRVHHWWLFHNGIIRGMDIGKTESDTACMARMLRMLPVDVVPSVLDFYTSSNRFALVDSTGETDPILLGNWIEEGGVWYSSDPDNCLWATQYVKRVEPVEYTYRQNDDMSGWVARPVANRIGYHV